MNFMTHGILGVIACPMLEDNLVYELKNDPEAKHITVVENKNNGSVRRKMDSASIQYDTICMNDVLAGRYRPDGNDFNILLFMLDLGLHSRPEILKSDVEELTRTLQPHADAFGFYLGTCGTYNWDMPKWCAENNLKPSATFCDADGNLCHDCVGVNIAGGPRYNELQKKYLGHLYVFPAMASNYDDFMLADQADSVISDKNLTDEMREVLGIEPGLDGYMRWLLTLGHYEYILKIDTGIGNENFEKDLIEISERTRLKIKEAEEGWASLQPTADLYAKCKSLLKQ